MPIGFRQGYAGVRNAQLALARERAVLVDMERQVVHDVSNAVSEKARVVPTGSDRVRSSHVRLATIHRAERRRGLKSRLAASESISICCSMPSGDWPMLIPTTIARSWATPWL